MVAAHHRRDRARAARSTTGTSTPRAMPEIEAWCGDWARRHLRGYTGMANFETIGGRIIEAHLRFADQWPDLYGAGWVEALIRLYADGRWAYRGHRRRDGYSVVLFGPHGPRYRHPPRGAGGRGAGDAGRFQRADHVPRGQATRRTMRCRRAGSGWRS